MSGTITLGRVRPKFLGEYETTRAYDVLERVKYNGQIYECAAKTTPGIAPDSAEHGSAYWTQISVNNSVPQAVWTDTELAFEYPDGTVTTPVDLRGPEGPQGVPGPVNLTSDLTSTAVDVALSALGGKTLNDALGTLKTLAARNFAPNTREIIMESGEWEAPVTGTYRIAVFNGGWGAVVFTATNFVRSGFGFGPVVKYMRFEKGQKVAVEIGAAGVGQITTNDNNVAESVQGGITTFGDISGDGSGGNTYPKMPGNVSYEPSSAGAISRALANGGGFGGGESYAGNPHAHFWGSGGGAYLSVASGTKVAGNGSPGCVMCDYYDPAKDAPNAEDAESDGEE